MRVTPIPDSEIMPGHLRIIMRSPDLDPTGDIRDAEMLAGEEDGVPVFRARIELEKGDLERLAAGEPFWVSFWAGVFPFSVDMTEPP